METGIFSRFLDWIFHPLNSDDGTVMDWVGFLAIVIIVSFLWSTVVNTVEA